MDKARAQKILESRKMISEPNKYRLTVSTCQDFFQTRGEGENQVQVVAIANFKAMTPYHAEQALKLFGEGEYQKACNQNLSLSILDNGYKPESGEQVDAIVERITNKDGEPILVVSSIIPVKAVTELKSFSFGTVEEETPSGEAGDIA